MTKKSKQFHTPTKFDWKNARSVYIYPGLVPFQSDLKTSVYCQTLLPYRGNTCCSQNPQVPSCSQLGCTACLTK